MAETVSACRAVLRGIYDHACPSPAGAGAAAPVRPDRWDGGGDGRRRRTRGRSGCACRGRVARRTSASCRRPGPTTSKTGDWSRASRLLRTNTPSPSVTGDAGSLGHAHRGAGQRRLPSGAGDPPRHAEADAHEGALAVEERQAVAVRHELHVGRAPRAAQHHEPALAARRPARRSRSPPTAAAAGTIVIVPAVASVTYMFW